MNYLYTASSTAATNAFTPVFEIIHKSNYEIGEGCDVSGVCGTYFKCNLCGNLTFDKKVVESKVCPQCERSKNEGSQGTANGI